MRPHIFQRLEVTALSSCHLQKGEQSPLFRFTDRTMSSEMPGVSTRTLHQWLSCFMREPASLLLSRVILILGGHPIFRYKMTSSRRHVPRWDYCHERWHFFQTLLGDIECDSVWFQIKLMVYFWLCSLACHLF